MKSLDAVLRLAADTFHQLLGLDSLKATPEDRHGRVMSRSSSATPSSHDSRICGGRRALRLEPKQTMRPPPWQHGEDARHLLATADPRGRALATLDRLEDAHWQDSASCGGMTLSAARQIPSLVSCLPARPFTQTRPSDLNQLLQTYRTRPKVQAFSQEDATHALPRTGVRHVPESVASRQSGGQCSRPISARRRSAIRRGQLPSRHGTPISSRWLSCGRRDCH